MSAKVSIYNKQNKTEITPQIRKLIRKSCNTALKKEEFAFAAEIDVSIVDDEQIRVINNQCRNIDASTDVLSFPLGEDGEYDINPESGACMLGDVVLSAEHAVAQAELYGHSTEREIAYLTVHSVLHLLGYDHVNSEAEKRVMRQKEEIIMSALGLSVEENL